MQKIETVLYDEKDIELLKKWVNESPCKKCSMRAECCGCPNGNLYREHIKEYEDANLWDLKRKLIDVSETLIELERLKDKIAANLKLLSKEIPSELTLEDIFSIRSFSKCPEYLSTLFTLNVIGNGVETEKDTTLSALRGLAAQVSSGEHSDSTPTHRESKSVVRDSRGVEEDLPEFVIGHKYHVDMLYKGENNLRVTEEFDLFKSTTIPVGTLLAPINADREYEPFKPGKYYPKSDTILVCTSTFPLKFMGEIVDTKDTEGFNSIFNIGYLYDVGVNFTGEDKLVVQEAGTNLFKVVPEGTLMCQMLYEDDDTAYKPFTLGKYYPLPNSTLRCVSVNPLKFTGSMHVKFTNMFSKFWKQ